MKRNKIIYADGHTQYCYDCGFDAGRNGANTMNSNFTLFSTHLRKEAWEKGNKSGLKRRETDNLIKNTKDICQEHGVKMELEGSDYVCWKCVEAWGKRLH